MEDIKICGEMFTPTDERKIYYVSKSGKVFSPSRFRVFKPCLNAYGYYSTTIINFLGQTKHVLIHRLIAQTFIPNPENKPQVNHINGKKTDNRVTNLEWCTAKENIQHARVNGLYKKKREPSRPGKLVKCNYCGKEKYFRHSRLTLKKKIKCVNTFCSKQCFVNHLKNGKKSKECQTA